MITAAVGSVGDTDIDAEYAVPQGSEDLLLLAWRLARTDPDPAARRQMRRLLTRGPALTDEVIMECAWDAGLHREGMRILAAHAERDAGRHHRS